MFFLDPGLAKWQRGKRIRTLEWLGEDNKRTRKKAWRSNFDNIAMGLNESDESSVLDSTEAKSLCKHRRQVPKVLQNLYLLLTPCFCSIDTIISLSVRPTYASSLTVVYHCLSFFKLAHGVFGGPCLILHLTQKNA